MFFKIQFKIPIIKQTIAYTIYAGERGLSSKFLILPTPTARAPAFTSYCKDGLHVLIWDYDGTSEEEIVTELSITQEYYGLGDIYIFQNDIENSYMAICLDKCALYFALEVIGGSSADKGYRNAPLKYGLKRWVYRYGKKGERKPPKYLLKIKSLNTDLSVVYEKSNSHRILLNTVFNTKIKKTLEFDDYKDADLYSYLTSCKIKKAQNYK